MARAIQPFHTIRDGDVLFAFSMEEAEASALTDASLAELAWDAVLRLVA